MTPPPSDEPSATPAPSDDTSATRAPSAQPTVTATPPAPEPAALDGLAAADPHEASVMRARLGERIRSLRLQQGLRLVDVAALAGLSEPHLSRLEHGQRWPSLPVLVTLARIYGVDTSVLLWDPVAPPLVTTHTATARWQGTEASGHGEMRGRAASVRYDRQTRLAMADEPSGGRRGKGGSPEELVGMALAGSYAMALTRQLEAAGYAPRAVEATAELELASSAAGHAISEARLRCVADVSGIAEDELDAIAQATKRMCVVGRALIGVSLTVDVRRGATEPH